MTNLTPLAYFAAHAPIDVPAWFQPLLTTDRPKRPDEGPDLAPVLLCFSDSEPPMPTRVFEQLGQFLMSLRDGNGSATAILSWWTASRGKTTEAQAKILDVFAAQSESWRKDTATAIEAGVAWAMAYEREKIVQWPWWWAKHVLAVAQRSKIGILDPDGVATEDVSAVAVAASEV